MQITKQQLLDLKPCSIPDLPKIITLEWALENIPLKKILWVLSNLGYKKEIILFSVFCARQNENLLSMKGIYVIKVVERFAHGMAERDELRRAAYATYAATADAAAYAAYAAYAANAAAYAANAAAYAANAAAYAANAAAAAATAAAAAAATANAAAYAANAAAYADAKSNQLVYLKSLFE